MSKYYSLAADFAARTDTNWTATFAEIERILGFRLPASARTYSAWWANSRDMHIQHYAWLDNGWRSEDLNLTAERITFRRDAQPATPRGRSTRQGPADRPHAPTLYNFSSVPRRLTGSFSMTWQPIGAISLDQDGRLLFPRAPDCPGLYCFRLRRGEREVRYIGESDNVERRFVHYRNPGPSQPTNIRVNSALLDALRTDARIAVETMTDGA